MTITIKIDTANAAFEDAAGTETARILRRLADDIAYSDLVPGDITPLRDYNGNMVGSMKTSKR